MHRLHEGSWKTQRKLLKESLYTLSLHIENIRTYVYIHVHTQMHIHVHICIHIDMYTYIYVSIYEYTDVVKFHQVLVGLSPGIYVACCPRARAWKGRWATF